MSSVFDIARSGIRAFQTALEVTATNIANVHTTGYARQDVRLTEILSGAATPLSGKGMGAGVAVADVTRAFSSLLADRTRLAASTEAAATQRATSAAAIESFFTAGQGGIDAGLAAFYRAMSELSAAPASSPLRQVVVQSAGALAGQIADTASGLTTLRQSVGTAAGLAVSAAGAALAGLASVNADLARTPPGSTAANALASTRDRLLADLGGQIGITVSLDPHGRAEVSLAGSGAKLLSGDSVAQMQARLSDRLELDLTTPGGPTRRVAVLAGGALGGLADALGMLDAARAELDGFAVRVAGVANSMQTAGADLAGAVGMPMFSLRGWHAAPAAGNAGTAQVALDWPPGGGPQGPLQLTAVDGGDWVVSAADGAELGRGRTAIAVGGLAITLTGAGRPGDSFQLNQTDGAAANMRLLLTEGGQIAAARRLVSVPAAGNTGNASVTLTPSPPAASGLVALADLLSGGSGAAAAVSLKSSGMVATVPAQGGTLALTSVGQPARASFATDAAALAGATALELVTPRGTTRFDLTRLADGTPRPPGWGADEIAAALNDGRLRADGMTLAAFGGQAAGRTGQLQIAVAGELGAARLVAPGVVQLATLEPGTPAGGAAQVFTRNGVHLAGSPLSPTEAAALLTPANGFLPGAAYDAGPLNTGYRGMTVTLRWSPGAQTATFGLGGVQSPVAGPVAARPVTLGIAGVGTAAVTVPAGASAAQAAGLLDKVLPGVTAKASTAVLLQVGSGEVSFGLRGANGQPVAISAAVTGNSLVDLAARITATAPETGLRAELAPDGQSLLVVSDQGDDINITDYRHAGGGALTLTEATAAGQPLGGTARLDATNTTARIAGQVALSGAAAFTATVSDRTIASVADAADRGMFTLTSASAGAVLRLAPVFDPAVDASGQSGGAAFASGTRYSVTVGPTTATVAAAEIGAAAGADVAQALAQALRQGTPSTDLTGTPLAGPPPDCAALDLIVDGQPYRLAMENGNPVVTGPEPGRVMARFGADNRMTLTLAGSTDGAGIRVADPGSPQAVQFGLGADAVQTIRGAGLVLADIPPGGVDIPLTLGGVAHALSVRVVDGQLTVAAPAGLPGMAGVDAEGRITLALPQAAGAVAIGAAPAAGFATLGAAVAVSGGSLVISAAAGRPHLSFTGESLAPQRLGLQGLPPEDLLVGMTGAGPLTLAGAATAGTAGQPALTLVIVDAAKGEVALTDALTGDRIASGQLDAEGRVTLGGHAFTVGPGARTGDRYTLSAAPAGSADGENLSGLLDAWSGAGGLTERFGLIVSDIGSQTAAAKSAQTTATGRHAAARMTEAELSAVDLDTEAGRLLSLQQAYQGNAKALTVARDLFDTLLKAI